MAVLVISYSRADQKQVRALVSLLKGGLRGVDRAVYWDDQFEPGDPWFEQLKTHIDASPQLFVFWCGHASASPEVRREFMYTLDRQKRVVPVLLDDTPLADELAPIHGIDLRGAVQHAGPVAEAPAAAPRRLPYLALAAAAVLMLAAGAAWLSVRPGVEGPDGSARFPSSAGNPAPADAGAGPPDPVPPPVGVNPPVPTPVEPPPPVEPPAIAGGAVAWVAIAVVAALVALARSMKRQSRRQAIVREFERYWGDGAS